MNLEGRNFLTLKDYTEEEITYLLDLAAELKEKKKKGKKKMRQIGNVEVPQEAFLAVLKLDDE